MRMTLSAATAFLLSATWEMVMAGFYRYFSDESVKMGSIIKEIRKQEEK